MVLDKLGEKLTDGGSELPYFISEEEADKDDMINMVRLDGEEAMHSVLGADRQVNCVLTCARIVAA
jgi:hypothetical protein